jgi:hypothetical protein
MWRICLLTWLQQWRFKKSVPRTMAKPRRRGSPWFSRVLLGLGSVMIHQTNRAKTCFELFAASSAHGSAHMVRLHNILPFHDYAGGRLKEDRAAVIVLGLSRKPFKTSRPYTYYILRWAYELMMATGLSWPKKLEWLINERGSWIHKGPQIWSLRMSHPNKSY